VWLRKPVVELRAVTVWGFALAAFAAINVFVFGCAVAQLLGADISWFRSHPFGTMRRSRSRAIFSQWTHST
jgi:hypothetical protein